MTVSLHTRAVQLTRACQDLFVAKFGGIALTVRVNNTASGLAAWQALAHDRYNTTLPITQGGYNASVGKSNVWIVTDVSPRTALTNPYLGGSVARTSSRPTSATAAAVTTVGGRRCRLHYHACAACASGGRTPRLRWVGVALCICAEFFVFGCRAVTSLGRDITARPDNRATLNALITSLATPQIGEPEQYLVVSQLLYIPAAQTIGFGMFAYVRRFFFPLSPRFSIAGGTMLPPLHCRCRSW